MSATPFSTVRVISATNADRAADQDVRHTVAPGWLSAASERALVLGGGGSAGNAWLIGVVAGLLDSGVDLTEADLIIGTSAGSTAAAQITSADPRDLLAATVLAGPAEVRTRPVGPERERRPGGPAANHLERTGAIIGAAGDPADMRRRLSAAALEIDFGSDGSRHRQWRSTVAARLPSPDWPNRAVLITAVDARAGEPVVFDRDSGIDLADAVAASCASGPPHGIGAGRYIDGGYRRNENADLAAGCGRVLVLSPLGGRTRTPLAWGMHLAAQIEELHASGSNVETIVPDADSLDAFGTNLMDLSARPAAARSGFRQGADRAESLAEFWR